MIKKIAFAMAIVPALYWSPPALRFNIVQAAEPAGQAEAQKPALQAHAFMTQTYLNAALAFLDGLDRQLGSDVSVSDKNIKTHIDMYGKEALSELRSDRVHFTEYVGVFSRVPAESSGAKANLDKAISLNETLWAHLQDASKRTNRDLLKDDVEKVRSAIKDSLSDVKSLKYGS